MNRFLPCHFPAMLPNCGEKKQPIEANVLMRPWEELRGKGSLQAQIKPTGLSGGFNLFFPC